MAERVTFGDIHRLLEKLGFVQAHIEGPHVLFEHEPSGVLLGYRPHRRGERVDPMTLSVTKKMLDLNGFVEETDFEKEVRKATPKRRAKPKKD